MTDTNETGASVDVTRELLPCPFCGGNRVKTFGPYGWYRQWGVSHSCKTFYGGTQEMAQGFATEAEAIAAWNTRTSTTQALTIHIVFDGPPGPEAGRFVECETSDGKSVSFGEWTDRGDGYWALVVPVAAPTQPADAARVNWQPIAKAPKDGTQILVEVAPDVLNIVSWWGEAWREPANGLALKDAPTWFIDIRAALKGTPQ
ncbi:Lar family restriction alleviation protein [Croceicoccus sp. YJ47]|uniref:Lar family restriction alleviation protein n=1 Tax=Croceicoccus sp. YJ47 TaxID=2798724 RepID=UPI0019237410|nr:Lar family restriction alleviation protein [Croceicoccus sp. YJ47]QQN73919.1 Lar family restriction alleviation protein [Croceicoccus sp. YJ47]